MKEKARKTVAVLFGGPSVENEISVITGLQAYEHIDRGLYSPIPIFVTKENQMFMGPRVGNIAEYTDLAKLITKSKQVFFRKADDGTIVLQQKGIFGKETRVDIAHLCFHGGMGEGGGYQGYFDVLGLPYTGCSAVSAGIGMDKSLMKQVLVANDLPTAQHRSITQQEFEKDRASVLEELEERLMYPLFVKPARSGSSIGVNKAQNQAELVQALEVAFLIDTVVLVEESFEGAREYNISVLGSFDGTIELSEIEEVFAEGDVLDFDSKYLAPEGAKKTNAQSGAGMASTKRNLPAKISTELKKAIQDSARQTFVSCQCSGVVRIDFLARPDTTECIVIEINTFPGSMAYYLWEATGIPFQELNSRVLGLAEKVFAARRQDPSRFTTDILSHYKDGFRD